MLFHWNRKCQLENDKICFFIETLYLLKLIRFAFAFERDPHEHDDRDLQICSFYVYFCCIFVSLIFMCVLDFHWFLCGFLWCSDPKVKIWFMLVYVDCYVQFYDRIFIFHLNFYMCFCTGVPSIYMCIFGLPSIFMYVFAIQVFHRFLCAFLDYRWFLCVFLWYSDL